MPMVNLSCWGVIRRSVFVSNLFAAPGQQPVRLTPAVHALLTVEEFLFRAAPIPWDQLRAQYDYVVVRRTQRLRAPPLLPTSFHSAQETSSSFIVPEGYSPNARPTGQSRLLTEP